MLLQRQQTATESSADSYWLSLVALHTHNRLLPEAIRRDFIYVITSSDKKTVRCKLYSLVQRILLSWNKNRGDVTDISATFLCIDHELCIVPRYLLYFPSAVNIEFVRKFVFLVWGFVHPNIRFGIVMFNSLWGDLTNALVNLTSLAVNHSQTLAGIAWRWGKSRIKITFFARILDVVNQGSNNTA